MDNDQLEKRLDWLDDERRKDKALLSALEERLLNLEGSLDSLRKKDQEMDSDLTRLRTSVSKVDDFEAELASMRVDRKKEIKDQDKAGKRGKLPLPAGLGPIACGPVVHLWSDSSVTQ